MTIAYNAPPAKPAKPYQTDEYGATNEHLWEKVLQVARGDRRQFSYGDRTIHAPNHGRGFRHWPSPKATAWAVKQYNGFNGGWKKKDLEQREAGLKLLQQAGLGILATKVATEEQTAAEELKKSGYVRLARVQGDWHYWTATWAGGRILRASLATELSRRMDQLFANFDAARAKDVGEWFENNFRINSPKTPKGGKALKEKAQKLIWVLKFRAGQTSGDPAEVAERVKAEVASDWKEIEPHLQQLVTGFTDEGGKIVPKDATLDGVLYVNEVGADEATFEKYVKRLAAVFKSIHGWRSKALKSGLRVVLSSPRSFSGTASGKYRTAEDAMYVRATPNILKRDGGYGSFEYILVHELGHRFERFNRVPLDFDKTEWLTTHYSMKEGESFAELFALSHFKYTGTWDPARVERFDAVMAGG